MQIQFIQAVSFYDSARAIIDLTITLDGLVAQGLMTPDAEKAALAAKYKEISDKYTTVGIHDYAPT